MPVVSSSHNHPLAINQVKLENHGLASLCISHEITEIVGQPGFEPMCLTPIPLKELPVLLGR